MSTPPPARRGRDAETEAWRQALIVELIVETDFATSVVLDAPERDAHKAGQSVDVRVIQASGDRQLSGAPIASAPEDGYLMLTISGAVKTTS